MNRLILSLAIVLGVVLTGCGGGDADPAPADSPETVTSSTGAGSLSSLDIASGAARSDLDGAVDDPLANLSNGTLCFRRLDLPSGPIFLACCEITRGQWSALAAAAGGGPSWREPWADMQPPEFLGVRTDEAMPASGLTAQLVRSVLADYRTATGARLRLPSDEEWLAACFGGGGATYSWGEQEASESVRGFAVVAETRTSAGPDVVGGRGATRRGSNPRGFYDLHGNVWELTAPGADGVARLRGGSWADNLRASRASPSQWTEEAVPHALIGARLVLESP